MNAEFKPEEIFGFFQIDPKQILMFIIAFLFIYLAIKRKYEPFLFIPLGIGIIIANIPPVVIDGKIFSYTDINTKENFFYYLYFGIQKGIYPAMIFLGIGAMTDFSPLIGDPRLFLIGGAAQFGIFLSLLLALSIGFNVREAGAIGIIGGADGPSSIFLSSILAPELLAPISIAAYSYIALVPVIQPPILKLLTTKKERMIRMPVPPEVSTEEKIIFPIIVYLISALVAPGSSVLLGMFAVGNLLKESGVTERLAKTARGAYTDIITILIGLNVGVSTSANVFLTKKSLLIFFLGAMGFILSTVCGVIFVKFYNLFTSNKINPLIGGAGLSAMPNSARVAQQVAAEEDPTNFILLQAMGPNVAGGIGSAICAGILWSMLK